MGSRVGTASAAPTPCLPAFPRAGRQFLVRASESHLAGDAVVQSKLTGPAHPGSTSFAPTDTDQEVTDMSEHPPPRDSEEEVERERQESTDLGYRDTEEERAYEEAEQGNAEPPANGAQGAGG